MRCALAPGAALVLLLPLAALPAPLRAQANPPGDTLPDGRPRPHVVRALAGVAGLNVVINRIDCDIGHARDAEGRLWACVDPGTWAHNLRYGWTWDVDAFHTNMFLHPYHGAMYFNAGRSSGLDFWESAPLAFLGSLMWEYFGETERPSLNDLYNTGFGGIALGEVFHRLATLVRDDRRGGTGRALRELAALPLDPLGSLNRWLHGGFGRVGPNPPYRDPGTLGLVVQTGGRVADDSGATAATVSPSFVADLAYGDPFRRPYAKPFDVFRVRLQVSPDAGGINLLRVKGRLWAKELTAPAATARHVLTLDQQFEYIHAAAYRFGGQSVELGIASAIGAEPAVDVRTEVSVQGLLLGALDTPDTLVRGAARAYDFGPGTGATAAASLEVKGTPVLSGRAHWGYLHSVSGSPADHYVVATSLELILPITREVGLGGFVGWFQRHSEYAGRVGATSSFPEYRVFLTWQPNRRPALSEEP